MRALKKYLKRILDWGGRVKKPSSGYLLYNKALLINTLKILDFL